MLREFALREIRLPLRIVNNEIVLLPELPAPVISPVLPAATLATAASTARNPFAETPWPAAGSSAAATPFTMAHSYRARTTSATLGPVAGAVERNGPVAGGSGGNNWI